VVESEFAKGLTCVGMIQVMESKELMSGMIQQVMLESEFAKGLAKFETGLDHGETEGRLCIGDLRIRFLHLLLSCPCEL